MRRDTERLQDILEAIANIQRYTNQGKNPFNQNELIQIWVIYYLQVIGEAANALSEGSNQNLSPGRMVLRKNRID